MLRGAAAGGGFGVWPKWWRSSQVPNGSGSKPKHGSLPSTQYHRQGPGSVRVIRWATMGAAGRPASATQKGP